LMTAQISSRIFPDRAAFDATSGRLLRRPAVQRPVRVKKLK